MRIDLIFFHKYNNFSILMSSKNNCVINFFLNYVINFHFMKSSTNEKKPTSAFMIIIVCYYKNHFHLAYFYSKFPKRYFTSKMIKTYDSYTHPRCFFRAGAFARTVKLSRQTHFHQKISWKSDDTDTSEMFPGKFTAFFTFKGRSLVGQFI